MTETQRPSHESDELKPCPFCGSTDIEENATAVISGRTTESQSGWVECRTCTAEGPTEEVSEGFQPARDAWNRRAPAQWSKP